jgi:hypothetical protein
MVDFLSGALTLSYLLAGIYFLRFWRKTRDRLFLHFAFAFWLFALNQIATFAFGTMGERTGYIYVLRVLGFGLIMLAIVDKNALTRNRRR